MQVAWMYEQQRATSQRRSMSIDQSLLLGVALALASRTLLVHPIHQQHHQQHHQVVEYQLSSTLSHIDITRLRPIDR